MEKIREQLLRDGYAVLENFLDAAEVERLRDAGVALTSQLPKESERVVFSTSGLQQNHERYFLESSDKVRPFFDSDAVDAEGRLLVSPELALNKVGHALHVHAPPFSETAFSYKVQYVCHLLRMRKPAVLQSMYIYKNPGASSLVTPHQDSTFLHTQPQRLLGFWLALDDADTRNGCLRFVLGSHHAGVHRRLVRTTPDPADPEAPLLTFTAPAPVYPASNFTAVPVKKGSCILIHGEVVHDSGPNTTSQPRHVYTFHVADLADAVYSPENWLQLPEGQSFPPLYR